MEDAAQLIDALTQWRRLAELEATALEAGKWKRVAECQEQKDALKPMMEKLIDALPEFPPEVVNLVPELLRLEKRNDEIISEMRRRRQAESDRAGKGLRDLQGVRRAYGSSRCLGWQSYS